MVDLCCGVNCADAAAVVPLLLLDCCFCCKLRRGLRGGPFGLCFCALPLLLFFAAMARCSIIAMIVFCVCLGKPMIRPMYWRRSCLSGACTAQSNRFPSTYSLRCNPFASLCWGKGRARWAVTFRSVVQIRSLPLRPSCRGERAKAAFTEIPQTTSVIFAIILLRVTRKHMKVGCESRVEFASTKKKGPELHCSSSAVCIANW